MKLLLICFFVFSSFLQAADLQVQGIGYGISENEGIQKAKRDALEKGIGQTLISQTEVENFMVKKDVVLTRTAGNVKDYKVLESNQGTDGAWKVVLQATVSQEGLRSDLQAMMILVQAIDNPRVALLIKEEMVEGGGLSKNGETYLLNFFKERTFDVVDPNLVLKYSEGPEAISAMGGDPEAMANLGSKVNAEVLVVGDIKITEADLSENPMFNGTGFKSVSATVSLKAFDVSTRKILAAANGSSPGAHIHISVAAQKAIEKALSGMMNKKDQFFDRLTLEWQQGANDGAVFELTVEGVDSFSKVKEIKTKIAELGQDFNQRSFKKPSLIVEIKFVGSIDDLCTHLDGMKINGGTLSVQEFQGRKISLQLQ